MTFYASSELDVTLEVDGVRFRVVHFGAVYSLNQIPRARCILEIGREAFSGNQVSKIHSQLSSLKRMKPCKIIFQGYGEYSPGLAWPDQETVIFEGYIMGAGFEKANGKAQYSVDIVHWLYDLDCTSTVSKYSHVSNDSQYTFQAIIPSRFGAGTGGDSKGSFMLFASDLGNVISVDTIEADFWGKALKQILVRLAESEHVQFSTKLEACLGELEGENSRALAALARIEGVGEGHETDLENSCYTPVLALTASDADKNVPTEVVDAISMAVGTELVSSLAGQTAWSKLLTYGSNFFFSVVPQAERALVVPIVCGLRDTYCKTISINDYDFVQMPAAIVRPLRAVGVWGRIENSTGLSGAGGRGGIIGLGGCFAPEEAESSDGVVRLVNPPAWLANVASVAYDAGKTSGVKDEEAPSTATTPLSMEDTVKRRGEDMLGRFFGHKDGKKTEDVCLTTKDMYDRYAHAYYMLETLRGREGTIAGKLRFDIAPGSNVRIEVSGEQHFDDEQDDLAGVFVACVVSVSIDINAETGRAGTGFTLKHTRTDEENSSNLTSIAGHPLYTSSFTGAPLVPDLAFPDEGDGCCFGD